MVRGAEATTRRGFTMVELLVVIGIIVVIIGLILVVAKPLRESAWRTRCLANQRQIAIACTSYASDNNGRLPSPRTDTLAPESGAGIVPNPWVNCTQSAGTLTSQNVELKGSLEKGVLWTYMDRNYDAYRSPLDPTKRIRSYSLNAYIGVGAINPNPFNRRADELYSFGKKTPGLARVQQPARTLCSIPEEDAPGYNRHGWVIKPDVAQWIDLPAFWDDNRINISLLDGSTESLNILSPKLIKAMDDYGNYYNEPYPSPAWTVMKGYLLPGDV
ncbi:MAG: prepilin-type N-terminal cleavage/methylation domain-containing protein [Phycisphaerales bacterium]